MSDNRPIFLILILVCLPGFGVACSTDGETQRDEVAYDSSSVTAQTDDQPAEVDADQWRAIAHPSDPIARHFPQIIAPKDLSHDALPCRMETSEGEVSHLEFDEAGRRSRFINELPPNTPPGLPIFDTVYTYSYDGGELVNLVISPVEEDESKQTLDFTIEVAERDEFGNPLRHIYGGSAEYEIRSTYDDERRLIRSERFRSEDGELMNRKDFSYDEFGRLERLEDDHNLDGEANTVTTYIYSEDGRLREHMRENLGGGKMLEQLSAQREPIVVTYIYECDD